MAVKLITDTKLKKALADLSADELKELIVELSAKIKPVRELLSVKYGSIDFERELCEKYKAVIHNEFFPNRREPGRGSVKAAKMSINDFKQVSVSRELYVDILLYCVEECVKYTNAYGDIDEQFYNGTERIFEMAVNEVNQVGCDLYDMFAMRFEWILENTRDLGWGFSESMENIYYKLDIFDNG